MAIKTFKPYTPSRRHAALPAFDEITTAKPERSLSKGLHRKAGRNSSGRITVRHRGGGHKRRYREIDFRRNKFDVPAKVATIEYDPNRSARIALLHYLDGEKRYILAPVGLEVGQMVVSGSKSDPKPGNTMPLSSIPLGMLIHNLEMIAGRGGQCVRSAGSAAQLMSREGKYAQIKLPSGEIRRFRVECLATVGQVGNADHSKIKMGKAGRKRWLGIRPTVRGVAMNPVDHPMGGGEGRTSGGGHPVSPWGQLAKGGKTRARSKPSNRFIVKRRKK